MKYLKNAWNAVMYASFRKGGGGIERGVSLKEKIKILENPGNPHLHVPSLLYVRYGFLFRTPRLATSDGLMNTQI